MPASLEACRECIEDVSELTGEERVVGDDELDAFDWEPNEGDTEGESFSSSEVGSAVRALKDWSTVGDKLEVSVNAEDIDIESAVVLLVFAPLNASMAGTIVFGIDPVDRLPSVLANKLNSGVDGFTVTYLKGK